MPAATYIPELHGIGYYPEGVKAALHVMCGGGCYRPECGEPAIRFVDEVPEINLEIAHIHALEDGGPREIRTMTIAERNAFSNVIWLCRPCHKRVDGDERAYPASELKAWKRDRERQPLGRLAGLRDLDVTGMEELLRRAMTEIRQDMTAFAETFPDLAALLRETIEGFPSLDPESLHMLTSAATHLELPEYAPIMHYSANSLELPEYVPMLAQAARDLDLANQVPMLRDTADNLANTVQILSQRASQIKAAAHTPDSVYIEPVEICRNSPFLVRIAVVGCLGWLLIVLLIYLHVKGHF